MATPGRRGPKLPLARMERAVEFRILGCQWGEISRLTGTPIDTLHRWQRLPEWKALETEWLDQDPLARRARAVIAKALMHDLLGKRKGRPDTNLAERLLAPRGNGDGEPIAGAATVHRHIVELPIMDQGLKSKPPSQVLLAPPAAPVPPAAPAPAPKGKKPVKPPPKVTKRTVVGPDE